MLKTAVMPKHTDIPTYNGETGEWETVPRFVNDNVSHGGDWWITNGDSGILNASLVEAMIVRPCLPKKVGKK